MNNFIDPKEVRKTIINILYKSKASHLGSNMSAVESLIAMYSLVDIDKIINNSDDRSKKVGNSPQYFWEKYSIDVKGILSKLG